MSEQLPKILRVLRNHVASVLNAINEYERLTLRNAWGAQASEKKQDKAMHDIERRLLDAAASIGITPTERHQLYQRMAQLSEERDAALRALAAQRATCTCKHS